MTPVEHFSATAHRLVAGLKPMEPSMLITAMCEPHGVLGCEPCSMPVVVTDADPMPVFTIKAKDRFALDAVKAYRQLCVDAGLHNQAFEVSRAICEMIDWRDRNPKLVKTLDHRHVPVTS